MTNKIDLYTAPLYTKEYTHAEFHFNVNIGTHAVVGINVVVVNGDKARAMAPGTNPYVVIEEPLPNPEFITMGWATMQRYSWYGFLKASVVHSGVGVLPTPNVRRSAEFH